MLAMPAFAATEAWHQVTVTPGSELILGGAVSDNTVLAPTITANDSQAAGALSIRATAAWKLEWTAVQGSYSPTPVTTPATGTNLGTTGFTNTGGYAYVAAGATTGSDTWSASFAAGGTGATLNPSYALAVSASNVATGVATSNATITPTYSAGTSGSLGTTTYYGTIYYALSTTP
jgi:hypothetical protein